MHIDDAIEQGWDHARTRGHFLGQLPTAEHADHSSTLWRCKCGAGLAVTVNDEEEWRPSGLVYYKDCRR